MKKQQDIQNADNATTLERNNDTDIDQDPNIINIEADDFYTLRNEMISNIVDLEVSIAENNRNSQTDEIISQIDEIIEGLEKPNRDEKVLVKSLKQVKKIDPVIDVRRF
mgnify:CR=1 FL=1